jgi:hypothetical protein
MLSTSAVTINEIGGTASLGISQANFTGTFTQVNTCGGSDPYATFSATSASGPSWSLTITGARAGECSLTVTGAGNAQASASITVTSSGINVNSVFHQ